ncbi:MAG: MIP/aquaporin family protein [Solirubrobacterales bacterium]
MPERVLDRGFQSYIAEFLGTLLLVFFIGSTVTLYVAQGAQAQQFGSDFAVVGLVHGFLLFILMQVFAATSGAHLNPALTGAALIARKITPIDAAIYVLVQLSGGVAGALLVRAFLVDEGRAGDYGAATTTNLVGGAFQGALIEAIGTFVLALVFLAAFLNPRARAAFGPLAVGLTLGVIVMVLGPLTGGAVNPARWFGPALVGGEFGDVWPYVVGPLVGAGLAALVYRFVIEPGELAMGVIPTEDKPKMAPEAPGKRL